MRSNTPVSCRLLPGTTIIVAGLFTLLMSAAASAGNVSTDNLTAREIIEHMESVYAKSDSYSDSGVVKIIFTGSLNQTIEKPFTTAFIRPDRFRYEFREREPFGREQRFIIHLDGDELQTYWTIQHDLQLESLDRAVAAATGVSQGSAITVPAMLLPDEITWRRAIRFSQPKRIDDQVFDGTDCFRLQDMVLNTIPVTLWIDKETFLLRKIYREQTFEDFRTRETTVYRPSLNGDVPDQSLAFNPPEQRR